MEEKKKERFGSGRSRLLYQITFLLIVVLVIIGVVILSVVNGALNRLIEEEKRDRIDSEAEIIYNDAVFISDIQVANILSMTDVSKMDVADFVASVNEKRINDFIRNVNDGLQDSVNRGMAGSEALLVVLVSDQGFLPKNMVMAASRDDLTFVQVPDYLVDAFDEGKRYLYLDEGVPELGFQGEYLVSLIPLKNPYTADNLLLAIRPFHNEVARIDDFHSREKNRLTLILVLVIAGGIILIFLVTFFILRRMIYKQITKPIYELASAAGEVMEGNLDVEIEVHKGEEFESLKNAFREMLKTIRDIVNRSLEGEK